MCPYCRWKSNKKLPIPLIIMSWIFTCGFFKGITLCTFIRVSKNVFGNSHGLLYGDMLSSYAQKQSSRGRFHQTLHGLDYFGYRRRRKRRQHDTSGSCWSWNLRKRGNSSTVRLRLCNRTSNLTFFKFDWVKNDLLSGELFAYLLDAFLTFDIDYFWHF